MIRPADALKVESARFARLLGAQEDLAGLQSVMHDLAPSPQTDGGSGAKSILTAPAVPRIGPWLQTMENGHACFVRVECNEAWRLWADTDRIEPKGSKKRVVLHGESVARGFFYDPSFNPAQVLRTMLDQTAGPGQTEVIDLARSGITYEQLQRLLAESMALRPDVMLIFAGNNWHVPGRAESINFPHVADLLRKHGSWRPVARYVEDIVRQKSAQMVEFAGKLSAANGVPIVWLVPEFNLVDWRNTFGEQVPVLSSDELARWSELLKEAQRAMAGGDAARAAQLARETLAIDDDMAPTAYEILADGHRAAGNHAEARRCFELARDTGLSLPVPRSPRCYSSIQETLRSYGPTHGIGVVDLPSRFTDYLEGTLPDRRLFLDYCHLNTDGIQVAMASAAERLLPFLGYAAPPWRELLKIRPYIESRTIGRAHLLAALHTAGWGQGPELVRYHCNEALRRSPDISQTMLLFLDFHIRKAPAILCRSFDQMAQHETVKSLTTVTDVAPPRDKALNLALIDVLASALEGVTPGVRELSAKQLTLEYGEENPALDLLQNVHCGTTIADFEHDWHSRIAYFQAYRRETEFRLICLKASTLDLTITFRIPDCLPGDTVAILLNGTRVVTLEPAQRWQTAAFAVNGKSLHSGLNALKIIWPCRHWSKKDRIRKTAEEFDRGPFPESRFGFPNPYVIFGEIHRLTGQWRGATLGSNKSGCNRFEPALPVELESGAAHEMRHTSERTANRRAS